MAIALPNLLIHFDSSSLKVRRVITDDDEAILGRIVSSTMIESVYREFAQESDLSLEEKIKNVLAGNTAKITNSLRLRLSKVMYQDRIEILGWNKNEYDQLVSFGCFGETIRWEQRLFLSTKPEIAEEILKKIIKI